MERGFSRHVAIWIDSHQAMLLILETEPYGRSALYSIDCGCTQHHVVAQQYPSTQQYYEAVLSNLHPQDEILILGPGMARDQLCQRIEQYGNQRGKVVGLQHAPKLAEVELVFPTDVVWRSGRAGATQLYTPFPQPVLRSPEKPRRF